MRLKDLTNSELMFMYRRRHGYTQAEAASLFVEDGNVHQYRAWETGEETPTRAAVREMRIGGSLQMFEIVTILRRRDGTRQPELAEEIGVSTNWLCRMEKGSVPVNDDLLAYWNLA